MHRSTRFRVLGLTTGALAGLALASGLTPTAHANDDLVIEEANASTPIDEVDEALRRTACENLLALMEAEMGPDDADAMTVDECLGAMSRDVSYCYDPAATVSCISESNVLDDVLACKDACMSPPVPKAEALAEGVEAAACENLLELMRADAGPDAPIPSINQCIDSVRTTAVDCVDYEAAVACVTDAPDMNGVASCERHCSADGG